MRKKWMGLLVIVCVGMATGCDSEDDDTLRRPETTGASVWSFLQAENYQDQWQLWPGQGQLYEGNEPHGLLLTTYLNDIAYDALQGDATTMPDGAIIVKENYVAADSTLDAVTTMYKVAGYNPEHNDWFFVKQDPDGVVEVEGKVAGCQSCHQAQRNNDYLFTGSLR